MSENNSTCSFIFMVFIAVQIVNVLSAFENAVDGSPRCYKLFNFIEIKCARQCPETFPEGRCLKLETKQKCFCGNGDDKLKLYTTSEANKMYKVCNNRVQNDNGCKKLCSKHSYLGFCNEIQGIWQCVCYQNNYMFDFYTLKEAMTMRSVCNSKIQSVDGCSALCPPGFSGSCQKRDNYFTCYCTLSQDRSQIFTVPKAKTFFEQNSFCNSETQNNERCNQLCPSNFEGGGCGKHNEIWECYCSQQNYEYELYSVSEANSIYHACYGERKPKDGCHRLCPDELKNGHCYEIAPRVMGCGCKRNANENEWYTVRKAYKMTSVCNGKSYENSNANEKCNDLCPHGFTDGKCEVHETFWECFCKRETGEEVHWVTLKEAIAFKQSQKEGKRRDSRHMNYVHSVSSSLIELANNNNNNNGF